MEIIDEDEFTPEKDPMPEPYRAFTEREGIPVHDGLSVNVYEVDTGPWERTGQLGAFINLYGMEGVSDLHLHEIRPGEQTTNQRHVYEAIVWVLSGHGATIIDDGDGETAFEWGPNSLFYLPHNAEYRFENLSEDEPAKLVSHTGLPQYMNMIDDEAFLFDSSYNPWHGDTGEFYAEEGTESRVFQSVDDEGALKWEANFIPDITTFDKLQEWSRYGTGRRVFIHFPGSSIRAHISEYDPGHYKPAHRHQPGSQVPMLKGEGYSLLWREEWDERIRIDWEPGTILTPPAYWYHQHFNLSEMRELALHPHRVGTLHKRSIFDAHDYTTNVIEYVDEDPELRELYREELEKRGQPFTMPDEIYTEPGYQVQD